MISHTSSKEIMYIEEVYGVDSHFYRGGVFVPKRGKYTFKAEVTDFDNKSVVLTRTVNFY